MFHMIAPFVLSFLIAVAIDHAELIPKPMATCSCCCLGMRCGGGTTDALPAQLTVSLDLTKICPSIGAFSGRICKEVSPGCCQGTDVGYGAAACRCIYIGKYPDPNPGSGQPYVSGIELSCIFSPGHVLNCPHNPKANCLWTMGIGLGCTLGGPGCTPDCPPCGCAVAKAACGDVCVDFCSFVLGQGLYFQLSNCTDADDVNHPDWMLGCNPDGRDRIKDTGDFYMRLGNNNGPACLGDIAEVSCAADDDGAVACGYEPGPCDDLCSGCRARCSGCIPCYGCFIDPSDPTLCPSPADCAYCIPCEDCIPCLECLIAHGLAGRVSHEVLAKAKAMHATRPRTVSTTQRKVTKLYIGKTGNRLSAILKQLNLAPPAGSPPCPSCEDWIDWMNRIGPEGCLEYIDLIEARLREQSGNVGKLKKLVAVLKVAVRPKLAWALASTNPVRAMILEAIKQAKSEGTIDV